jgi:LPXTG-site transpeptidase (sortase) family protein
VPEQLQIPIGEVRRFTDGTGNPLFADVHRHWVRQGIGDAGGVPSRHAIEGFGTAWTDAAGSPPRHVRGRPINLMPGSKPRFEAGTPVSGTMILGQVLILIGVLSVALAAWHLWGTGLVTAGEQARLADRFEERLLEFSDATVIRVGDEAAETAARIDESVAWDNPLLELDSTLLEPALLTEPVGLIPELAPFLGEPIGRIVIPDAEVDWVMVEGTTRETLADGPGHVVGSAVPGQVGNSVIAGHRTTNGAPFFHLDRVGSGSIITVETVIGIHTYEVVDTRIVQPTDTWVATQWEGSWLTLTTCHPRYSSQQRLVVFARLIDGPNMDAIEAQFGSQIGPESA